MEFYRTLPEIVDPSHTCVVVIDMQNDFCSPEGGMDRESKRFAGEGMQIIQRMIPNLKGFLIQARANQVRVAYFQDTDDDEEQMNPAQLELNHRRGRVARLVVAGTWGHEIVSELTPASGEPSFRKHRYSGLTSQPFREYLRQQGIRTLVVTGVGTAVCVESTVRDAFMNNYYVVVPRDCVAAYSTDVHEAALKIMNRNFARVVNSQEIVNCWTGAAAAVPPSPQ